MANDHSPLLWHCLDSETTARHLDSDLGAGLSADAAAARLAQVGPNALHESGRRHPLLMLASQFTDFMIVVLIAAAVIAGVVGEPQDAVAIVVIVVLNGIIGFVQEYRAERAMAALKKMAARRRASSAAAGRAPSMRHSWCPATWWNWKPATSCPPTCG